ncbi:MAG: YbfB/YjiJ family MFS transporter [Inquilinaceae bacterium]
MTILPATSLVTRTLLLALAPAIGLGFARFGYALILPDMRAELGWSYSQAGWMNTINAVGYLAGALLAAPLARRLGLWRVVTAGVWLSVAALFATGATGDLGWLSFWRLSAGVSGALCFVAGGAIAATIATEAGIGGARILGLYYAGPGFGILLSGVFIPPFLGAFGAPAWSSAWILLGVSACVLGGGSMFARSKTVRTHTPRAEVRPRFRLRRNGFVLLGYAAFGAGYIGYMTFMFALLKELGAATVELSVFWAAIGGAAMASPWLWGPVMARMSAGRAIAFLMTVTLAGAAMPLFSQSFAMAIVSAGIFGSAFFAVVAATTAFVRRNADVGDWTFAIGVFTVAFGLGQVVGPILVGAISDNSGNLRDGLLWGCAFLLAGVGLSASQKETGP